MGIFFKNIVSKDSFPNKLSYSLRNTDKWDTGDLYPVVDKPGPSYESFYSYRYYSAVQFVLNENFIRMKTRTELPQLELELFPYPEYTSDKNPRALISLVVGVFVMLTILILSIPLINDIIEEKDSGVKELMKISGLDEWMIWCGWFVHAIIISIISFPIVTWILTHPFNEPGSEAMHFVQYSVLLTLIILYCIANIFFCFTFSSVFHKAGIASSVFVICFALLFTGIGYLISEKSSNTLLKLFTITPLGAFMLGFRHLGYHEVQGIEFTWSSLTLSENDDRVSSLFCILMLVFDTFLYMFLTFYITNVNPGKFGARKSPLFLFESLFSSCLNRNSREIPLNNSGHAKDSDSQFFESPPSTLETAIEIKNLHKQFGSVYAVNGVNLNVYHGEMTALLGHNGAGKTTTMSIMTGLTSPSSGSIYFKNMDIFQNMESFRRHLGMCPQENRTMPYLSVMDHLLFFGQLKGVSLKEAKIEANEYLNMMEMQSKKNSLAKELSGGMKRKLCLSIALMGKAQVLILDEPTSGMDVQSRRKLWDLLLELRGKRTIIFTTHYMEEADALGDRIAIMNHGLIVCHGTPIFLKKAYATGYELTITKTSQESLNISQIVQSILPQASLEFESATEVIYKLPLTETSKFPVLFRNLESGMAELGIQHMGLAATTMEQVFLKVGGTSAHDAKSSTNPRASYSNGSGDYRYLKYEDGVTLALQQIAQLFKKKFLFTSRNLFTILTRIIIPTLIGVYMINLLPSTEVDNSPEPALDLSMSTYANSIAVLRNNGDNSNLDKYLSEYIAEKGRSVINAGNSPIEDELLQRARDLYSYNKNYISAFELSSTGMKLLFNPKLIHSLPITITTFSNALLRSITKNNLYQIETFNHPVPKAFERVGDHGICGPVNELKLLAFYFLWFSAAAFYTVDLMSYFSTFVNMERIDGFFHIQMMSNVSPFLYWLTTLIFDLALFLIIIVIRVGIFKIIDHSNFLALNESLGIFALLIILYGISGLLFTWTTGYLSSSKEGSYTLLFIFNLICGVAMSIYYEMENFKLYEKWDPFYKFLYNVAGIVILFVPSLNFSLLFIKLMVIFNGNTICNNCPEDIKPKCLEIFKVKSYLEFPSEENPDGLMRGIVFLMIDILLYAVILILINMGYVRYCFDALKNSIFGTETTNTDDGDADVQQEFQKVQMLKKDASRGSRVALLVDGLRKNYMNWFKPFTAVSNVNFVVEPGECFGLLGVNGAGKSTTFKMLTGEILPTLGDSSIEGIKLSSYKMRYLSMAGYCPQTNCFIEVLTGREMLSMIAAMRGVTRSKNKRVVDTWIAIMGLEEFQNQNCGNYSGGNKRKLCTAMSLIGDPRVVFLDEPTSGVDPVSRRNLYDVMVRSKNAGQAVILTSHSMEECETLCDRITIMAAGVMKCIGTAQHLKKSYAQGFSALIKIRDNPDFDGQIFTLKADMLQTFSPEYCILKDEHKGLLYYQIKDTYLLWSTLFDKMEAIKQLHSALVEDYVLTETTLEEVFMSFAKGV
ncbi:phospholipid-transporting ATPase ABCA1-like isoform X2 [Planococcus citri]